MFAASNGNLMSLAFYCRVMSSFNSRHMQAHPDILDFLRNFREQLTTETRAYLGRSALVILGTHVCSDATILTDVALKCSASPTVPHGEGLPIDWAEYASKFDSAKLRALHTDVAAFATPFFTIDADLALHRSFMDIDGMQVPLSIPLLLPKLLVMTKLSTWMDAHMADVSDESARILENWERRILLVTYGVSHPCPILNFCGGRLWRSLRLN